MKASGEKQRRSSRSTEHFGTQLKNACLSSMYGTFFRINNIVDPKIRLKKFFKNIEIISCILSDHNGIEL